MHPLFTVMQDMAINCLNVPLLLSAMETLDRVRAECADEKREHCLSFLPSFSLRRLVTWQVENGCFLYEIWPGSRQGADKKGRNEGTNKDWEGGREGGREELQPGKRNGSAFHRVQTDTMASFDRNSGGEDKEGSKEC